MSNVIAGRADNYGIHWQLSATTANGGALIRWSRVRVPPAPRQSCMNAGALGGCGVRQRQMVDASAWPGFVKVDAP
jgi:hypothetical protein